VSFEPNWGLLGHEWAVNLLKQQIAHNSVRHAYLFCGPPGLGRRTLAIRFARALDCPQPPAPGESCGACRTCQQIEAMQYPDLAVIQAEAEGGVLKIDQVREVNHSLSLKPYQSKYRVALFLRFQEANQNAQNALLKTLEEAPAHAILILTADNSEQLLPTIASRCEILRLRALPIETVADALQERGAESEEARLLAHLSNGRPGYALRLLADPDTLKARADRLTDLIGLLAATRVAKFAYAEKLAKDKDNFRRVLLIWSSFFRDVLLSVAQATPGRAPGTSAPLANVDRVAEIAQLSGRLSLQQARQTVSELERAVERLEKNVNPRLLAEVTLLDLPRVH
jgi:DNA polymerase III subunit delta'